MIKEYQYVNIKEILSRLLKHPLLNDITLEQVVSYTIDFIALFGMPKFYTDNHSIVTIENYRGQLPCDLIEINQIKNNKTGVCLRSLTNNFSTQNASSSELDHKMYDEDTFKTQGSIIFTSFKDGEVLISYKAIPLDEDGYPKLIDNPVFLKALETYIKKEAFTILYETGKISLPVYQNILQQYAWMAGKVQSEFTIPSISEMESISRMWCTLIQRPSEFEKGFKTLGNKEYIRLQ